MKKEIQYLGGFYRQDNKILFMDSQLRKVEAKCSPLDTFDEFEGCRIALCRAYNKQDGTKVLLEGDFLCAIPEYPNGTYYGLMDGKIYHFEKGDATVDDGDFICSSPAKSLEDLNNKFSGGNVKFRFYKVN